MKRGTIAGIIILSVFIAVLASYFASSSPDGLEKIAETLGFIGSEEGTFGFFSDYSLLTGIIGLLIVYALFKSIGMITTKFSK